MSLGRYEDLLDIERVDIVEIHREDEVDLKRDMYIPVEWEWKNSEDKIELPNKQMTVYNLTREYEITKQGLRRWKKKGKSESILLSKRDYVRNRRIYGQLCRN